MNLPKSFGKFTEELHLELPFAGSRMLRNLLLLEAFRVGRRRVGKLMRIKGIEAMYRRKNTSKPHPYHIVFRYLCRKLVIDRPNPVWAADLSYIPMVYLVAIIDWFCRRSSLGGSPAAWQRTSAWRLWRKPFHGSVRHRSSTLIIHVCRVHLRA